LQTDRADPLEIRPQCEVSRAARQSSLLTEAEELVKVEKSSDVTVAGRSPTVAWWQLSSTSDRA